MTRQPRAPAFGRRAMVVSGHSAASLAGIAVLKRGGSLADAMIAASAVLATVLGHATSIGGDCFILCHEAATGRTVGLNASGVAPAAATPAAFPDGMKIRGPLAPVVPGLVRAWEAMHRRYGKLAWRELFEDAIDLAENGHPVSQVLANRLPEDRALLLGDPGCAVTYFPDGRPLGVGDLFRQPALARTLQGIAADGADSFYRGATARSIGSYFAAQGGLLRASDLAAFQPLWVEPAATLYRDHAVTVMPPNSYGILLPMQLNGLSAVASAALAGDPVQRVGYQMSAMKAAFALGRKLIADPEAIPDAVWRALAPEMTQKLQQAVLATAQPGRIPNRGGTSCLLLADAAGNAICVVQSVFNVFGSAFLDPGTGIIFNNRMQGFAHRPDRPDSVAPGKRPPHTLCPVLVLRDGRVRYVLASPGGPSQTLTNAQVITHLVDGGRDVATAVEAPRWCNARNGEFLIEDDFPESVLSPLAAMGHSVKRAADPYYYGSAKAIEILGSGTLAGAGDHRREAFALGW
ncbi:MAG TPA: gamma-glutamyltransferase family protein [Stellaceae bacterium]|nr:gamma-glutamyltransferase family protein [Stellaceae bacterium]